MLRVFTQKIFRDNITDMVVKIYSKDGCVWCDRAAQMCEEYQIPY